MHDHLFSGRAIVAVDPAGRMTLPPFVIDALERRSGSGRICFGIHERDSCLQGYDEDYGRTMLAEIERRRVADQALGRCAADHHTRLRRAFGFVEQAQVAPDASVTLPALLRRMAAIRKAALIVGVGATFELWSPRVARHSADPQLRELADLRGPAPTEDEREIQP